MYWNIVLKRKFLQLLDDQKLKTNIVFVKMKQDHFYIPPFLLGKPDYHLKYPILQNL